MSERMETARNDLFAIRRRVSLLFAERYPKLRVAMTEDFAASGQITEIKAAASGGDPEQFDPKTQSVLNPETGEEAQFLLLMFCGYRDFRQFDQADLVPLVEHLQGVANTWELREPHLWAQILDDPAVIERLNSDDEGEDDV